MNRVKVSENFSLHEFACKCGCQTVKLDESMLSKLQKLRIKLKKSIVINSGYRCSKHNKTVGGATNSNHMKGNAVDIRVSGMTPSQLAKAGEEVGFTGIGTYKTFVHLDTRPKKTKWKG